MSPKMKDLPKSGGLIDLYHNDLHALKITLLELAEETRSHRSCDSSVVQFKPSPIAYIMLVKTIAQLLASNL